MIEMKRTFDEITRRKKSEQRDFKTYCPSMAYDMHYSQNTGDVTKDLKTGRSEEPEEEKKAGYFTIMI